MTAPKNTSHLQLSALLASIPLEKFRLSREINNRQWKDTAGKRREFWLSEFVRRANPDGTFVRIRGSQTINFSPSWVRLEKHKSKASIFRRTEELKELGLLLWDRANKQSRRVYLIPPSVIKEAVLTFQTQPENTKSDVSNSISEVSDSNPDVSLSQNPDVSVVEPIRLLSFPSVSNPPPPPPENKSVEAVGWLTSFYGQTKKETLAINRDERGQLEALAERDGLEVFQRTCEQWIRTRDTKDLVRVANKLIEEYDAQQTVVRAKQLERSELIASKKRADEYGDRQAEKRQAEVAQQLAAIRKVNEHPATTADQPF